MTKKTMLTIAAVAIALIVTVVIILVVRSGNRDKLVKPDNTNNLALLAKDAISAGDYQTFQALFTTQSKDKVTKEEFAALTGIMTEGALPSNYTLLRLENGQMVLLFMTGPDESGEYQLQDARILPAEFYEVFNY